VHEHRGDPPAPPQQRGHATCRLHASSSAVRA
jgi:hypothetical protein